MNIFKRFRKPQPTTREMGSVECHTFQQWLEKQK